MSAAGSLDPNGTIASYSWDFGDGSGGSGSSVSHTYSNNGTYTVKMIATDNDGLADTVSTTSTVSNVAPVVLSFAGATLLPGETYSTSGSFTDPGVDTWSATVDYGDGSGTQVLALQNKTFSLSHTYTAVGTFTTTASVFDGDDTGVGSQTVTVISTLQGVGDLKNLVTQLITDGTLPKGNGGSLTAKLGAAAQQLQLGGTAGINELNAFNNEVDALVRSGRLSLADANTLKTLATRIIQSASL
jgi:PKD repeat protein